MFSSFLTSFGRYLQMLKLMFSKPENFKMYWKEFMTQCYEIGYGSLPIVLIISVFLGAVTTVQTAYQLVSPLIPQATIAQIVRESMILELSPTVLSIVLAGVVGSKVASELGNMRVSEQIDALEIMGINSASYLVLPKILASIVVVPCLVVISIVVGIWGGRVAGSMAGIISPNVYDQGARQNFTAFSVVFALIKSYTFAFLISSISAYFGYYVKGGSLEIGRASTKSVVVSCIMILFADYILAAILL
ncbi:ABC transporter permease [Arachidicoccus ginsenosidimutans]|uniref:MlaE family ABC transporter permease n=1 Tax=Arachidicoccus sp. BS20 TaxID=1850526 RepID=UPI0007F0535B|nr:ABC transporter permease [Arachidicoccus sp. BS20]ANI90657.1 ABC transporter permease [Arachidicoccus sp. BS20]